MTKKTIKTGKELERRVAQAYRDMGARKVEHDVELAGHQIDVYVELETPDRALHRIAVEAKDYTSPVGIKVVTEFLAVVAHLRREQLIEDGVIVSAAGFSRPARNAAKDKGIRLLEPADLGVVDEDFDVVSQEYCEYLVKEYEHHIIRGFSPQVSGRVLSLPISEIFLPLQAVEGRPALAEYAEEDLRLQAAREVMGELDWQQRLKEAEKRYAQLSARQAAQHHLTLAELLKEPRSVLLGDPGTGKTTVTRYVTYALAAGDVTYVGENARGLIPVLVRIANYAKAYEQDSTLHLIEYIEKELPPKPEFGRFLRHKVEEGQCLVILDGLDEVGNVNLRTQVTDRIRAMVAGFGNNRFMVTSRIVGYEHSPLTREFKHATLQELTQEDRERFVRLWYDAIETELRNVTLAEDANDLIQALRAKPQIARMAANPLLLTIIVLMHWRGVKLPNRRVQVYQNATDTLIEYWTAMRGVAELDAEEVKDILAPIAHHILSSNVAGVIAHADLLPRFHQGIIEQRGCGPAAAKRIGQKMLRNLNEDSGLFLERGRDTNGQPVYGFLHQTFGEYLAALCLVEEAQSGTFDLAKYIHLSIWHEPFLLMAGHLSLVSKPQANMLVRDILDFPAPYEEVLQRNTLLAADCLADDVHVTPDLRDEVLNKLARLLEHETPQVQAAAVECYKRLQVTRHREAALAILKHVYALDGKRQPDISGDIRLNLATALVYLAEKELARPVLNPLEGEKYKYETQEKAGRLRFEGWPEEASDYLVQLQADRTYGLSIQVGADLASCTLGPVDAGLARRVLGEVGLLSTIAALGDHAKNDQDKAALQWLATIASEDPSAEALIDLVTPDIFILVRRLAATRLLQSEHRKTAILVLKNLLENEPDEAAAAAQALLEAGEKAPESRGLLHDIALMGESYSAPAAIASLLALGDEAMALPAALHLLSMHHPEPYLEPEPLWAVTESLIKNERTRKVGLAAAHWLALRPGYRKRIEACEALLEAGRIKETIPLLQYLAYECHDEAGQRACERLLALREAERVVPILAQVADQATPKLRYQACLALAWVPPSPPEGDDQIPGRSQLKEMIFDERKRAHQTALCDFCESGLAALAALETQNSETQAAQALGRLSLHWLRDSCAIPDRMPEWDAITNSNWPALRVNAASFELRWGQADYAHQRLVSLLNEPNLTLSLPVQLQALAVLGMIVGSETTSLLTRNLKDKASDVRRSAAEALGKLGDSATVEPLIEALSDEDSRVCFFAIQALGKLGNPAAVEPLLAALSDEDHSVRRSAAEALGKLGDPAAVEPLLAALSDEATFMRGYAAEALGKLGDSTAAGPLMAALSDENSFVRQSAAEALGKLGDPAAMEPLIEALSDEDSNVRLFAALALGWLGDPVAVDPLLTVALSDEDSNVRLFAALALGWLGDPAVEGLLEALNNENSDIRRSAAEALGSLGDPAAVEPLLAALNDEDRAVRLFAAAALGKLGSPAPAASLITALNEEDCFIRGYAAEALGSLGDPAAVEPLLAALSDEDSGVRRSTAEALGKLGDSVAVEPLLAALSDEDSGVRRSAAEALGKLGDPMAVGPLMATLSDEDSGVRGSAAEALGWLEATETSAFLALISTATDSFEAQGYARALVHLEPNDALPVLERYAYQFRRESWVERLRGQAQWRLGNPAAALVSLKAAVMKEKNTSNLLALAHFYLEQGDLNASEEQVNTAIEIHPKEALCLLSQAVLLWERSEAEEALEKLTQAQQRDRKIARAQDLEYEYFWGPKALTALEAMLAQSATTQT
jgi:HEAT repeat protein